METSSRNNSSFQAQIPRCPPWPRTREEVGAGQAHLRIHPQQPWRRWGSTHRISEKLSSMTLWDINSLLFIANIVFAFLSILISSPEAHFMCLHHIHICHLPDGSDIATLEAFERSVELLPSLLVGSPHVSLSTAPAPGAAGDCQDGERGKTTSRTECSSHMRSITCYDTRLKSCTTALCGSCSTII